MNSILQKVIKEVEKNNPLQTSLGVSFKQSDIIQLFSDISGHFSNDLVPNLLQLRVVNNKFTPWVFYFAVKKERKGSAIRFRFNDNEVYYESYETILCEGENPPKGEYDAYVNRYSVDGKYMHTYLFFDKNGCRDKVIRDDGVMCFYIENHSVPFTLQDQMENFNLDESIVKSLAGWTDGKDENYVIYTRPIET